MTAGPRVVPCLSDALAPENLVHCSIGKIVTSVRAHLGMDVGFISEFKGETRIFHQIDYKGPPLGLEEGQTAPLEDGYCKRVTEGKLPNLIPDTSELPIESQLPDSFIIPVGAHLSVPIILEDGRLYGTFCCVNFAPDLTLNERDVAVMKTFAEVIAFQIDREQEMERDSGSKRERIREAMAQGEPRMVYQPVFDLKDRRIVAVECLSRFSAIPVRTPDIWFAEAAEVGLGAELERCAIQKALRELATLDADFMVTINVSSTTVLSETFAAALTGFPLERIVLEITEHEQIAEYGPLIEALQRCRALGMKVAVDDAGAGYASMCHLLHLHPHMIKLDLSLTRDIDTDPAKQALATSLVSFARATESEIIAEGVETKAELTALSVLGVRRAQGYYLAKPMSLEALAALIKERAAIQASLALGKTASLA